MHAGNLLSKRAELTPDKEALLDLATGHRFTFAELEARANRTANWLRHYSVGEGDRVSILAHNSVVFVDFLYGCGKIGAIFAPLNWRLAAAELRYIINDCTPTFLVLGEEFAETMEMLQGEIEVTHVVRLADYEAAVAKRPSTPPPLPPNPHNESPPLTPPKISP